MKLDEKKINKECKGYLDSLSTPEPGLPTPNDGLPTPNPGISKPDDSYDDSYDDNYDDNYDDDNISSDSSEPAGPNLPNPGNDIDEKDPNSHKSQWCIKLQYQYRDHMLLVLQILTEEPKRWKDVQNFLMFECKRKRIFRSRRERPPKACFNEFKTDRDDFLFLRSKLMRKPECVLDLVEHLVNRD